MRPLHDYVHIKLDPPREKTGAIVRVGAVADYAEGYRVGTVLAVGPGLFLKKAEKRHPLEIEKGSRVAIAIQTCAYILDKFKELLPKDEILVSEDEILWEEAP